VALERQMFWEYRAPVEFHFQPIRAHTEDPQRLIGILMSRCGSGAGLCPAFRRLGFLNTAQGLYHNFAISATVLLLSTMAEYDSRRQLEAVAQQPPLFTTDDSSTASPSVPTTQYEIDLLLTADEAKLIETFRQEIHFCETDTEKFDKCIQKRDELLEENDKLVLRLAAFEHVMSAECILYRGRKERTRPLASRPRTADENGAAKWDRFVGVAAAGSDTISKLLPSLKAISLHWGKDFIQHYQLAGKGQYYCNLFSMAIKLHTQEKGVRKLNQLLLRRFRMPGRRGLRAGANPIEPVDLRNLASWRDEGPFVKERDTDQIQLQFVDLTHEDLPLGFIFDQFGLMVRGPPGPVAGTGLAYSGLGNVIESITATTSTEERASILPTAVNKNVEDAGPRTPLTAFTTTPPSHSQLSTPLSTPPESPHIASSSAAEEPSENTALQLASIVLPDDSGADNCGETLNPRGGPINSNMSVETVTGSCDNTSRDATGSATSVRLRPRNGKLDYHEAPVRSSKPANPRPDPPGQGNAGKKRCCPPEIPAAFLAILDKLDAYAVKQVLSTYVSLRTPLQNMCHVHLKKFTEAVTNGEAPGWQPSVDLAHEMASPNTSLHLRRRRASLPDLTENTPKKRLRLDDAVHSPPFTALRQEHHSGYNQIRGEAYRRQALEGLQSPEHMADSWGMRTNELVSRIMQKSKPPTGKEAYFLCGEEAAEKVEFGQVDAPIFTQSQQRFQWRGKDRPIQQFFHCLEDLGLDRTVSVQVPSRALSEESCERKTLYDVQDRFFRQRPTNDPWNLLDLQNPIRSTLPPFLEGGNCQLLLQVRDAILTGSSAERVVVLRQDWNAWRNVTEWALLSEGGHNTAPHTDSHGYSTWITAQEGHIGFGWMSRPSQEQEEAWISHPHNHTEGEWRYVVLSPGDTVFFPSGTIHFVFRVRGEQTFALGGHILQWSSIDRWLEVLVAQMKNPGITNEDTEPSASKYVHVVKGLLDNRTRAGRKEEVGGQDVIDRFSSLLRVS
jgi:hypothetical protein